MSKLGLYMRLSKDDEKAGESASIENQRIILQRFAAEKGFSVAEEYVDDGYSGTNFERPAVKRLLDDAKNGKIDIIAVKDLSRFGRNYIQVGQYIDYIFPAYGIRFIALSDNVDTADRASAAMDMMPVMNVFNEWHAANTSKKIRAVLEAEQRAGRYTGWNYPYGYKAGNDESRTAVIDDEAAKIVKKIYELRLKGNSARTICKILTESGIPNPATYYTRLDGKKAEKRCSAFWCAKTVMHILSDPTYTGKTIQHKTTSISYKNHKIVKIPASDAIVKENAHQPIIDEVTWKKAQEINKLQKSGRADKTLRVRPLSGVLVCPDCGKKLKLKSYSDGKSYYVCRTYADLGKKYCTAHRISEAALEKILSADISSMLNIAVDENREKEKFLKEFAKRCDRAADEKLFKECKNRILELAALMRSAFEEKVLRGLPESVFSDMIKDYAEEQKAVKLRAAALEKKLSQSVDAAACRYIQKLKQYVKAQVITRELCLQLIDSIKIGESGQNGERDIVVCYKFGK